MTRGECSRLESEVSLAIHLAEKALQDVIKRWETVEKAEAAILNSEDDHFLESDKTLAARGVGLARMRITVLKALLGKD